MRAKVYEAVEAALKKAIEKGAIPETDMPKGHQVSIPKQEAHGDFSSNLAMVLASRLKRPPRQVAEILVETLSENSLFERVEVAGPGFVNFFIAPEKWQANLRTIYRTGSKYGESDAGKGRRVLVEFVSANPTGPLHVGHGRGAAVGDSLARVLRAAGFNVETEYYINDAGNQMKTLGSSVYLRYLEHFGKSVTFPDDYYQGEYIKEIARDIASREGEKYIDIPLSECIEFFTIEAVKEISAGIKKDLEDFGVSFDNWFSEKSLHASGFVEETIEQLKSRGEIYEKDGALWFRTSEYGDEKDRVVRRSNGELTYFAADIAYHRQKVERGYDLLVDIWGADHHGYVPRVKAALKAMGHSDDVLKVLLVQLVNLLKGGKIRAMSTRAGEFVTLREVLDDVGRDAARFIFLTRKCDSHLDFDLDLAKQQSQENPVYYVQYAHARLCSVFSKASEQNIFLRDPEDVDVTLLNAKEELVLIRHLDSFPRIVADSAISLEPHRISYYLTDLAGLFHGYYTKYRFVSEDEELTQARLFLAHVTKQVFRKGLELLGVSAPEKM